MNSYCVKKGYQINSMDLLGGGENTVEDSSIYSYEVYSLARSLLLQHRLASVLDLGCGQAVKLNKLLGPVCNQITGVEVAATIAECSARYDWGIWLTGNLEDASLDIGRRFDLILAVDTIEHLANPTALLETIGRHARPETWVVLSTVERDVARGREHMGPPPHPYHIREWSFDEFGEYVRGAGFEVVSHVTAPSATPLTKQHEHGLSRALWELRLRLMAPFRRRELQVVVARPAG